MDLRSRFIVLMRLTLLTVSRMYHKMYTLPQRVSLQLLYFQCPTMYTLENPKPGVTFRPRSSLSILLLKHRNNRATGNQLAVCPSFKSLLG